MTRNILLSQDIEKLRCALCQHYLSVPPIMIISEHGNDSKCGRCQDIYSVVSIRNKIFETVAKLLIFPCIYDGCKKELPWGAAETHEQICPHKSYQCILELCSDIIPLSKLIPHHIRKKHPTHQLVFDRFERLIKCPSPFSVQLLLKTGVPYLIYYQRSLSNFSISVFSLKPKPSEEVKYEVKLSTGSNISVLFGNGTVTPFNEREHCARCLLDLCIKPHHKFSKANKSYTSDRTSRISPIQHTTIPMPQDLINFFHHTDFICTVNILEESIISNTAWKERSNCNNNRLLHKILQCPICLEFMRAEIYTCETGHIICNICKPKVGACPTCAKEFLGSRSYALEKAAENVLFTCRQRGKGCTFIGNVVESCSHQLQCSYKSS